MSAAIAKLNPVLNAFITVTAESALVPAAKSTEEAAFCCLVRKTAHGSEAEVDCTWGEVAGMQVHSVPDHHGLAER
jgi:hypothetical protein